MQLSIRWLKQFLKNEFTIEKLDDDLTYGGIEIEEEIDLGIGGNPIVVGKIISIDSHPNADKLTVCKVDVGQTEPLQIVCGAKNMKAGDHIPVAMVGAKLPGGLEIKKSELRGVESFGMLCSGSELGYAEAAEAGLLILPEDSTIGEPFDYIMDISITPNRPDWLSVMGVARQVAAMNGEKLSFPTPRVSEIIDTIDDQAKVSIDNFDDCPRYTARIIRDVKIAPSPLWLKCAVESVGIRSINNVVDITNYVLMEMGHPLHAFDLDLLPNKEIIVRNAKEGEIITTLDEEKRKLIETDLLICSPEGPVALAGIMGGANSEISDKTTNVLLECAYFNPATIRKTAKRLEMQTDSSYRFERGTDRENLINVINRTAQLIKEVAGGEILRGLIDVASEAPAPQDIELNVQRVNTQLGTELTNIQIAENLSHLGFELLHNNKETVKVRVPSHRVDIEGQHDLIEEVAIIHGYNSIESALPHLESVPFTENAVQTVIENIENSLTKIGFRQVLNYSFIADTDLKKINIDSTNVVQIANPITQEQNIMRPTLFPGILNTISRNHNHNQYDFSFFETGKVFWKNGSEIKFHEEIHLIAGLSGSTEINWQQPQRKYEFYDIKGIAERILSDLGIEVDELLPAVDHLFHPGQSAVAKKNNKDTLTFGKLHPTIAKAWKLRRDVFIIHGVVDELAQITEYQKPYQEFGKFPEIERDFAIIVKEEITASAIESIMRKEAGDLLEQINLFDCYRGERVGEGKKSLAFSLILRAEDKTLTDDDANQLQNSILENLNNQLGATLREG